MKRITLTLISIKKCAQAYVQAVLVSTLLVLVVLSTYLVVYGQDSARVIKITNGLAESVRFGLTVGTTEGGMQKLTVATVDVGPRSDGSITLSPVQKILGIQTTPGHAT